ncbi:DNA polymerase III subunit delta [Candidatus Falkowbacteria bacterium]|nr:DNA polymerase III subunit delta [Candidatus Falkowbacteria bacterium]
MVIFLYGQDTFRSKRKLSEFVERFLKEVDASGHSLTVLSSAEATVGAIGQAAGSGSLLSRKRMLVVEQVFSRKDGSFFADLYKYLQAEPAGLADNIVIFWDEVSSEEKGLTKERGQLFRWLAGQKYAQEFKPLSNTELFGWVREEVAKRSGDISREAATHLVALTGGDLWQIDQELNKLIHYKAGQKLGLGAAVVPDKIELNDVRDLVVGVFDEQVFALTDALSMRNRALAAKLLEEQLRGGESEEYLLHMVTRQFKILVQVRQALDSGLTGKKIATELKLHPFVAQKSVGQVRNFSLDQLKKILLKLIDIDYLVKTGRGRPKVELDRIIAQL